VSPPKIKKKNRQAAKKKKKRKKKKASVTCFTLALSLSHRSRPLSRALDRRVFFAIAPSRSHSLSNDEITARLNVGRSHRRGCCTHTGNGK